MSLLLALFLTLFPQDRATATPSVEPNDNLRAAGRQEAGGLTVQLYAGTGLWHPAGPAGPEIRVAAFGEEGGSLSAPGPLIRARVGTTVTLTFRNTLDSELRVSGWCSRPGPCDPLIVAAGASREVQIVLNAPGTFHYWASRTSATLPTRALDDTQLGGAIVVDPPGATPSDRIMVISMHLDGSRPGSCVNGAGVFTINGASWPHTSRLRYATGETAHWRVINLSCDQHAMHLHGFHFTLDAVGDGLTDRVLGDARRTEVTEAMSPGRTAAISWTPTRAGNWLFHCHMVAHMTDASQPAHAEHAMLEDAGMAGLVVGIEVTGAEVAPPAAAVPIRRVTMTLNEDADRYGPGAPGFRVAMDDDAPRVASGPVPGPLLVLYRDQPAEVTVVNRTSEPTAIHWHGIELDSYFDGVPGFSGAAGRLAPPIAPGESFVAKMRPPRAGTFIYHTHWHDEAQLAGGMYGPLVVLEPGQTFDPSVDHVLLIGFNGRSVAGQREPFALNGTVAPEAILLRPGVPNRLRLINITANNVALTASLVSQFETAQWTPIAKDGAALEGDRPAQLARQLVSVGETYDFEITPARGQSYWFDFRRGNGEWVAQVQLIAR